MRKLTTDQFLERAFQVHGNKYSYIKTIYEGYNIRLKITCLQHGDFWQRPSAHIQQKHGCPICFRKKKAVMQKIGIEEFIKRAHKIHKRQYNYSKVVYKNCRAKIEIFCSEHGNFKQTPSAHLAGQGCPICGKIKSDNKQHRLSQKDFVERAVKIHGNFYNYSLVKYEQSFKKILIICPLHGSFNQIPSHHLSGCGCPTCGQITKYCRSKGEINIEQWLINKEIHFIVQAIFQECRGKKRPLPFDFYLPFYNICIECDGPHHYDEKYLKRRNFKRSFSQIKYIDQKKNEYCLKNEIKLIRIRYNNTLNKKELNQILLENIK